MYDTKIYCRPIKSTVVEHGMSTTLLAFQSTCIFQQIKYDLFIKFLGNNYLKEYNLPFALTKPVKFLFRSQPGLWVTYLFFINNIDCNVLMIR